MKFIYRKRKKEKKRNRFYNKNLRMLEQENITAQWMNKKENLTILLKRFEVESWSNTLVTGIVIYTASEQIAFWI